MMRKALVIHPADNVANLIGPGSKGDTVQCTVEGQQEQVQVQLVDDIPPNHKLALRDIKAGDEVVKYGTAIGRASQDIRQGQHVHVHNIESNRGRGDLKQS